MKETDSAITTRTLMQRLIRSNVFDDFKEVYGDEMQAPSLTEYLEQLCDERNETHGKIIKRACIDRSYGHQIFSGLRIPTRDKVIQLAFGFEMDVEETQDLLTIARKSTLYPRIERDAAIAFCLQRKAGFVRTQIMLSDLHLPLLGREDSRE